MQVLALILHLRESGAETGAFLVIVPSSVLPNWQSELARWAPSLRVATYAGPEATRVDAFNSLVATGKACVVLTTFEYAMRAKDRARLARIKWAYLVMDEAHRIKNAGA
jgi:SNF2 family DNA or RNA helicase